MIFHDFGKARFTRAKMSSNISCEHQTLLLLQQFVTGNCHVLRAARAPVSSDISSNNTQLTLTGKRGWLLVCCVLFARRKAHNTRTLYSPCEGISLSLADFLSLTQSLKTKVCEHLARVKPTLLC